MLSIVRTHYRDTLFFLDVASVTATMKLDMSAGLDQSEIGLNGGSDLIKYSFGAAYTTSPTISYAPLQGEGFVKSVLSPIPVQFGRVRSPAFSSICRIMWRRRNPIKPRDS